MSGQNPKPELNQQETQHRQRALLLQVLRVGFLALLITITLLKILGVGPGSGEVVQQAARLWYLTLGLVVVLGVLIIAVDVLTPAKKISMLGGVLLGLMAAMLATVAISFVIDLLRSTYGIIPEFADTAKILVGLCLCYLGVSIVLQTQDDFRLIIPYVEFSKQVRGSRPLLLDSSALIDGRFVEIAQTGLIQSPVVIPRFVVDELQLLADNSDKLKRNRGRRGLEMVARLQRLGKIEVLVEQTGTGGQAVDRLLVELARQMQGMIVTGDLALTRVAQIHGVAVLNLNDLAGAVKPALVPGEQISLRLIRPGEQAEQGVGYLDDGTMVVVEDGFDAIDRQVTVSVVSSLQTAAGRMIFARQVRTALESGGSSEPHSGESVPAPVVSDSGGLANGEPARSDIPVRSASPDESAAGSTPSSAVAAPEPRSSTGPFPPNPARRGNRYRNPRR